MKPKMMLIKNEPLRLPPLLDEQAAIESLIKRIGIKAFAQSFARACASLEKKGELK